MGQYYVAIILSETSQTPEVVRVWLSPMGAKLMEHSYLKNRYVLTIEHLLSLKGMFYKSRLVWAGDYADPEPSGKNLYHTAVEDNEEKMWQTFESADYRYIVNHTKRLYIDKEKIQGHIHPLPLLTSEGNGAGGGDYRGRNDIQCGQWARDVISVNNEAPEGFTEFVPDFVE